MTPHLAELMRQSEFERWPRPAPGEARYFFWRFAPGPKLLDGWEQSRVQQEALPGGTRYTTSIWKPTAGEALLRLDVFEEPSRQAAELRLVELVGHFQSTQVRLDKGGGFPLFRAGNDAAVVFARGNLAFHATNAEREAVPLGKVVEDIGRLYAVDFGPGVQNPAPVVRLKAPAEAEVGGSVALSLEADYPVPCWFRIGTRNGDVRRDGSRLLYQADSPGAESVWVVAVGADGRAAHVSTNLMVGKAE